MVLLDGLIARPAPAAKGSSGHNVQLSDEEALSLAGAAAEDRAEVVRAQALDAVTGASVLSAAELSSSKQYLERADGEWAIAYLVSNFRHHFSLAGNHQPRRSLTCTVS